MKFEIASPDVVYNLRKTDGNWENDIYIRIQGNHLNDDIKLEISKNICNILNKEYLD